MAVTRAGAGGPSPEEAAEAADAAAALRLGGLAALLWAAVVLGARPADPGGGCGQEGAVEGAWQGPLKGL